MFDIQSAISSQRTISRSRGSDGTSYVLVRIVIELSALGQYSTTTTT